MKFLKFPERGCHPIAALNLGAVILLGVGTFTVSTIFKLAKTDDTQCVINVTGQQWWWEYDYPTGDCGGVAKIGRASCRERV